LLCRTDDICGKSAISQKFRPSVGSFDVTRQQKARRTDRVLVYRLGSLGDTVVALPCFHLIARAFPGAERRVLTNLPEGPKAPALATVLGERGLAHSYMSYPWGTRTAAKLAEVSRQIRDWRPDLLIYLAQRRKLGEVLRDAAFFRLSGIRRIVGLPLSSDLRTNRWIPEGGYYEPEAARLARCLSALGDARVDDPASWDLLLTGAEKDRADGILAGWPGRRNFLACSVGTKIDVKDWGVWNWRKTLARLSEDHPALGLVMVGAPEETSASDEASAEWRGPLLNLCGKITPRETAAVLAKAVAFVGHDSGPMHLAAIGSVPCTAVFSAREKARIWYPFGPDHRVIYHRTPCEGCRLFTCFEFAKICITSITVEEVYIAARQMLECAIGSADPGQQSVIAS
jgi:lipopolysaccharide heptosyltransferase III